MAPNVIDGQVNPDLKIYAYSKKCLEDEFNKWHHGVEELISLANEVELKICEKFKCTEECYGRFLNSQYSFMAALKEDSDIIREKEVASVYSSKMDDLKQRVNERLCRSISERSYACPSSTRIRKTSSSHSAVGSSATVITNEIKLESVEHRLRMLENKIDKMQIYQNASSQMPTSVAPVNYDHAHLRPAIPMFSGVMQEYPSFIKSFDTFIGNCLTDDDLKLNLLIRHCSGEAKKCVEIFVLMGGSDGYVEARKVLEERLGNMSVLAHDMIMNLINGPTIPPYNFNALQDLCTEMRKCLLTVSGSPSVSRINSCEVIAQIMQRLPIDMQQEWSESKSSIHRFCRFR